MRKPRWEEMAILHKGAWTKQEDQKLIDYVRKHGEGCWSSIPQAAGLLRCGKSCRLRWVNYLRPDLKRGNFGEDEEELIIKLHALLGNRWSLIAGRLPGRTDNEVKNYWNTHLRKKLREMGIDPDNHRLEKLGARSSLTPIKNHSEDPEIISKEDMPSLQESASGSEGNQFLVLPDLNLDLHMQPPVMENMQLVFDLSPPPKPLFGKLLI